MTHRDSAVCLPVNLTLPAFTRVTSYKSEGTTHSRAATHRYLPDQWHFCTCSSSTSQEAWFTIVLSVPKHPGLAPTSGCELDLPFTPYMLLQRKLPPCDCHTERMSVSKKLECSLCNSHWIELLKILFLVNSPQTAPTTALKRLSRAAWSWGVFKLEQALNSWWQRNLAQRIWMWCWKKSMDYMQSAFWRIPFTNWKCRFDRICSV